ncbi:hypothetical protein [Amycolatopsis speibonae]|uniref:DUF4333 domain-containing protein n=1 Tax=Amycolatopsis speibonae TaxID=1450224 RepID=A0ABV7P210_9PSEU
MIRKSFPDNGTGDLIEFLLAEPAADSGVERRGEHHPETVFFTLPRRLFPVLVSFPNRPGDLVVELLGSEMTGVIRAGLKATADLPRPTRTTGARFSAGAALLLFAAGCGSPAAPPPSTPPSSPATAAPTSTTPTVDLSSLRRGTIPTDYPKPDLSGLPPKPADSAPLRERIAWEALQKVTDFANHVDPAARSSCPAINPGRTTSVTCKVTYLDEGYDYVLRDIKFQGNGLTDGRTEQGTISYTAELAAGPIVRDRVETVLRHQNSTEYEACDMPEHVRFEFGSPRRRPSGSSIAGKWIHVPGISCRYLDPKTHTVSALPLELYESGAPIHPSSRIGG